MGGEEKAAVVDLIVIGGALRQRSQLNARARFYLFRLGFPDFF
jgi:hypothetical protein